jgi:hypothetical protein
VVDSLFLQNINFLSSPEFLFKVIFDPEELFEYFEGFWMKIASDVLLTF